MKFERSVDHVKEETSCRFCLNALIEGTFTVIDETMKGILDVLFLTTSVEGKNAITVCEECSMKLFAAFNFKTKCVNTENCIYPYLNLESETDLRDIYISERGKEHVKDLSKIHKICRLCMQIINCEFISVKEVDAVMLLGYIPEVNFSSTKDPVICRVCHDSLYTHINFLKSCLNTEEKIKSIYDDESTSNEIDIKIEEVEVKREQNDDRLVVSETQYQNVELPKPTILGVTETGSSLGGHNSAQPSIYKCDNCLYQTMSRYHLIRHQLTHKDITETRSYSCHLCDFQTKRKETLKCHQLKHKRQETAVFHKCDRCDFRTKKHDLLVRHKRRHDRYVQVQLNKCDKCDYSSDYKHNLRLHMLKHKPHRFKCNSCAFQTIYKHCFEQHTRRHTTPSDTQTYKCDECKYEAKSERNFWRHKLRHKTPVTATYQCPTCSFHTKSKNYLRLHELRHELPWRNVKFECSVCGFEADSRASLMHHQVEHNESRRLPLFKCDKCEFGTRYKRSLDRHEVIHSREAEKFQCDKCDFKSTYKSCLTRHLLKKRCRGDMALEKLS